MSSFFVSYFTLTSFRTARNYVVLLYLNPVCFQVTFSVRSFKVALSAVVCLRSLFQIIFHRSVIDNNQLMIIIIRRMEFSSGHSRRWLILTTVSWSNWNLECWFKWSENWRTWRKTLGARTRTNHKLNPVEPRPNCGRRALSLVTAPSPLT